MNMATTTCDHCANEAQELTEWPGGLLCPSCSEQAKKVLHEKADAGQAAILLAATEGGAVSLRTLEIQLKHGSDQQRIEAAQKIQALYDKAKAENKAHARRVNAVQAFEELTEEEIAEKRSEKARAFFGRAIGSGRGPRPESINTKSGKRDLWDAFTQKVMAESYIDLTENPESALAGNMSKVMATVLYWLLGEWMPEDVAEARGIKRRIDPSKSLVLWGARGTGKSTLAWAAHAVTCFWASIGWEECRMGFVNMDEFFVELRATNSLAGMAKLTSGSLVIDEMKEEHLRIKNYGEDVSLLQEVLLARHQRWKNENGRMRTVITTNIPKAEWLDGSLFTDTRAPDRMFQEYEFLEVVSKDYRGYAARIKTN